MALKLLAPGSRRGNKFWLVYGRHKGRVIERSTRSLDEAEARVWFGRFLDAETGASRLSAASEDERVLRLRSFAYDDRIEANKLIGFLEHYGGEAKRRRVQLHIAMRALLPEEIGKIDLQLLELERLIKQTRRVLGIKG
jgi:hypothetical protein